MSWKCLKVSSSIRTFKEMSGLFLLSISSPYLYHTLLDYIHTLSPSHPSPLLDLEAQIIYPIQEVDEDDDRSTSEDERKSVNGITRSDSEYSLGLSRSKSLTDIGETNFNALGLCSTGRITIVIIKYCGTAVLLIGILWQLTELTKSKPTQTILKK